MLCTTDVKKHARPQLSAFRICTDGVMELAISSTEAVILLAVGNFWLFGYSGGFEVSSGWQFSSSVRRAHAPLIETT